MKILISPAKSLDFESKIDSLNYTKPVFLNNTSEINSVLKQKTPSDLMKLQGISQKLSDLNWKRNNDFKIKFFEPVNFSNEESIETITSKLNKILEEMILKSPEQWIWTHNRWK